MIGVGLFKSIRTPGNILDGRGGRSSEVCLRNAGSRSREEPGSHLLVSCLCSIPKSIRWSVIMRRPVVDSRPTSFGALWPSWRTVVVSRLWGVTNPAKLWPPWRTRTVDAKAWIEAAWTMPAAWLTRARIDKWWYDGFCMTYKRANRTTILPLSH